MICESFNDLLGANWQTELQNLPRINSVAQILASAIGDNEFSILILATTEHFTSSQERHT